MFGLWVAILALAVALEICYAVLPRIMILSLHRYGVLQSGWTLQRQQGTEAGCTSRGDLTALVRAGFLRVREFIHGTVYFMSATGLANAIKAGFGYKGKGGIGITPDNPSDFNYASAHITR